MLQKQEEKGIKSYTVSEKMEVGRIPSAGGGNGPEPEPGRWL